MPSMSTRAHHVYPRRYDILKQGRVISFSEVGDPNRFAVFCCVGMGLTRYITAFYDELALTLNLRLITLTVPSWRVSHTWTTQELLWVGLV
jgi:hypothetical protein